MIRKIALIASILAMTQTVCAVTAPASTTSAVVPTLYCPHVRQLQKNPNPAMANWTAQTKTGLWKSYDPSFATNIVKLVMAQWTGEQVGQITCVYQSEQRFILQGKPKIQPTIPILMVYHTLTLQPSGHNWKHLKKNNQKVSGVMNCQAAIREDCPFKPHLTPSVGNVLEQAEDIKSTGAPVQPRLKYKKSGTVRQSTGITESTSGN